MKIIIIISLVFHFFSIKGVVADANGNGDLFKPVNWTRPEVLLFLQNARPFQTVSMEYIIEEENSKKFFPLYHDTE